LPPTDEEGKNELDRSNVAIIMVTITVGRFGMEQIQEYVPVTQAKTRLLDLVRKLKGSGDAIVITKNGIPEAVLISMEKFEGLLETLEILSDDKIMKALRRSMRDAEKGKWIAEDEVSWE
jgi:antitoxin YefM